VEFQITLKSFVRKSKAISSLSAFCVKKMLQFANKMFLQSRFKQQKQKIFVDLLAIMDTDKDHRFDVT
jgi:hypothetical protein